VTCRWDREAEQYLNDGEPCRTDDYGDPTKHCTARRTCSQHIGERELTCARCIGRTRTDIRQIVERAALMLPEAMVAGVDSEAANLAGPAADVEAWSWRKISAKQGRAWHVSLIEDDDDWHPETVLTRWAQMLTEDYRIERPVAWNLGNAAGFLDRRLHRIAQDDGQDFPLLAREMRKCRTHLESVLRDSLAPERGAPCPTCKDAGDLVRLVREYPHWCTDEACEQQFHPVDEEFDVWVCPRNREHWWTAAGYGELMDARKGA
jgi:hypothetical protein